MTPKEKANQLYIKFLPIVRGSDLYDTYHNKAKQCAIICIYQSMEEAYQSSKYSQLTERIDYWREVEEEINKIGESNKQNKNKYDGEGHLLGMNVGDFIVTKEGVVKKITHNDMPDLHYSQIARYATVDEINAYYRFRFKL